MTARFIVADVFDGLATLDDNSVDLVVTSPPFLALRSYLPADHPDKAKEMGSEATPAEFVDTLLKMMAELRRVLAPHGSVCVELGDTYSGVPGGDGHGDNAGNDRYVVARDKPRRHATGWPLAKSLSLIPEAFRMALAYGINPHTGSESPAGKWRIRNVIRWVRPNPPVGALGDKWRPATSELVVATLSGKRFWDDLATRKPHQPESGSFMGGKQIGRTWHTGNDDDPNYRPGYEDRPLNPSGAPLLDWWEIPPGGYQGAHYAVFPPELVEPCIKAMCPRKVCRVCGEPSRRIVGEATYSRNGEAITAPYEGRRFGGDEIVGMGTPKKDGGHITAHRDTEGWSDCGHDDWRPGIVLDPFAGSGTTLAVATGHGHDAIGIDIDQRNEELARDRVGPFLFETVEV